MVYICQVQVLRYQGTARIISPFDSDGQSFRHLLCDIWTTNEMIDVTESMSNPLEMRDKRHLEAAQGWLDLGNHVEANEELERIETQNRVHPDVLQVRWLIYGKAGKWDACLDIASTLTTITPDRRFGWLHRAFSLDKLGRVVEAKQVLLETVNTFGINSTFAYHLACFCARLGQIDEAKEWIQKSVELVEDEEMLKRLRLRMLDEPILAQIWKNIGD
jgi:tetratricopeptide (TPR) repeat protein